MTTFALLLGPPLLAALVAVAVRPYRPVVGWANAVLSLGSLGAAVGLWRAILAGEVLTSGPREFLRADALSTLLALCVSVVGALAAWLGPGMGGGDGYDGAQTARMAPSSRGSRPKAATRQIGLSSWMCPPNARIFWTRTSNCQLGADRESPVWGPLASCGGVRRAVVPSGLKPVPPRRLPGKASRR